MLQITIKARISTSGKKFKQNPKVFKIIRHEKYVNIATRLRGIYKNSKRIY